MRNATFNLVYWEVYQQKPYYDEDKDTIKSYILQQEGYKGFSICNYSNKELNVVKEFCKKTSSSLLEYYTTTDYHEEIGNFPSDSVCVWTKNRDDLLALFNTMPARNKTLFMPHKLKTKIPYESYKYYVGPDGVALSYSDPNDDFFSVADHMNFTKVMRKLTD